MFYFNKYFYLILILFFNQILVYAEEKPYSKKQLKSGSFFSKKETRAIENDDFSNPGMIWVEKGEEIFNSHEGINNTACVNCHNQSTNSLVGVAAEYPKIDKTSNILVNIEQKINLCRKNKMKVKAYESESDPLLSLSTYITFLSKGKPMNVSIDGEAKEYFLRGKKLYFQRIGQMNLACNQCHDQIAGSFLRSEKISQGHVNGFPSYLMRWDSIASVHRRFQFCNNQARAEPLEIGHIDYNSLQLYVAWRGNFLLIESPSVRR